jgi:site-specific recombinase XerD
MTTRTPPHTLSAKTSRSYVTHLAEDGFPEKFVSEQVGHAYVSTTALYTSVSDDFKNRVLARALEPAFGAVGAGRGR